MMPSMSSNVQFLNDSARHTNAPRCFRCMATSSIMPTPRLSTSVRKDRNDAKGHASPPQSPRRSM